jgi:hypothetical protein
VETGKRNSVIGWSFRANRFLVAISPYNSRRSLMAYFALDSQPAR